MNCRDGSHYWIWNSSSTVDAQISQPLRCHCGAVNRNDLDPMIALTLERDALTADLAAQTARAERTEKALAIVMPMAERWAEGGGSHGPEMRDIQGARAILAGGAAEHD